MSKAGRRVGLTLAGLLVLFVSYVGVLVQPGVLFAYKVEHGSFRVYSQRELGPGIIAVLDAMDEALRTSSLYDRSQRHDIFFTHDNDLYRALQDAKWTLSTTISGLDQTLTYDESAPPYFSHVITYRVPEVDDDALLHPTRRGAVNMTRTLTHEVVHSLLRGRFGTEVFRYPMWKQEGYPEYVAASTSLLAAPGYDFWASVERIASQERSKLRDPRGRYRPLRYGWPPSLTANEAGYQRPTSYYVARVLMEYSLDVKGESLEEVMSPATTDTALLKEMFDAGRRLRREPSPPDPGR